MRFSTALAVLRIPPDPGASCSLRTASDTPHSAKIFLIEAMSSFVRVFELTPDCLEGGAEFLPIVVGGSGIHVGKQDDGLLWLGDRNAVRLDAGALGPEDLHVGPVLFVIKGEGEDLPNLS